MFVEDATLPPHASLVASFTNYGNDVFAGAFNQATPFSEYMTNWLDRLSSTELVGADNSSSQDESVKGYLIMDYRC